jgi:DNA-binding transcriptional MocR family regulator
VIDLAWGHPDPELLPADLVAEASAAALRRYGPDVLGYGAWAGPPPLLDWLTAHLGRIDGRAPDAGELMITAGISQGLEMAITLLAQPGDAVLVPVPTYHLALRILAEHPVPIVPLATDEDGPLPGAVAEAAGRLRAEGVRPRLLFTVPTSGNPTGITVPMARRRELLTVSESAGITILEDDVYRELAYDAPAPPSLWSLGTPGSVVRLGSFSKTLAPGLRLGWLTSDAATTRRFVDGGLIDSGGGVAHFSAMVVSELAASGGYVENLDRLRADLATRRDVMVAALHEHAPSLTFRVPSGGYFLWLALPGGLDARQLLPIAEAHGVSYLPGAVFTAGTDLGRDRLRLCFTRYAIDDLREAARRLGAAVREASISRF